MHDRRRTSPPARPSTSISAAPAGRSSASCDRRRDSTDKVRWNFALVTVQSDATEDRAAGPYFTATVDRDGKFRIDDVPAGDYSLSVRFQRDDAGICRIIVSACRRRRAICRPAGRPGNVDLERR